MLFLHGCVATSATSDTAGIQNFEPRDAIFAVLLGQSDETVNATQNRGRTSQTKKLGRGTRKVGDQEFNLTASICAEGPLCVKHRKTICVCKGVFV